MKPTAAHPVKQMRERVGLSLFDLALRCRVNVGTIATIERGTVAYPRLDIAGAIAAGLGVPLQTLHDEITAWNEGRQPSRKAS